MAIQKVLKSLEWNIKEIDDARHHVNTNTKAAFMSWGSTLLIDALSVDKNTTRVSVAAETPVTTITSMVDFGRTRQQIDLFFTELAKQLTI